MKVRTRKRLGALLVGFTVLALAWGVTQPLPFVIVSPGPAFNVLGLDNDQQIIDVTGVDVEDTPGSLDMLTISVTGSPGNTPNIFELINAYFSSEEVVYPLEAFFPVGVSQATLQAEDRADFENSKQAALSAAKTMVPAKVWNSATVTVGVENVVGPSGGLMFTLGIIDKLTPGSLTGGKRIAGTGTIELSNEVGPIGGIRQKLISASRAGDSYFLAPKMNCDEVIDHGPTNLRIVPVSNLDDALKALAIISRDGDPGKLPTCSSQ